MKIFLTVICCSMFWFCHAQNPVNESTRSTGIMNEDYKDYWANGQLRLSYTLQDGNLQGEYLEYYKSGKLMSISYFDQGHFNGTNKTYNESGQILVEEKFAHDTMLYFIQTTYYKSGKIETKRELICDEDSLKLCPFIKPENTRNWVTYDIGLTAKVLKSHGKYYEYYESGVLKTEDTLVNNMMEGISKWFYENGKLEGEGTYHLDKAEGIFMYYSKTGEIEKKEEWQDGKLIKKK